MVKPPGIFDDKGKWNDAGVWDDAAHWNDTSKQTADDETTLLTEDGLPIMSEDGQHLEAETPPPVFTELPSISHERELGPAIESVAWTGRRTVRQQALAIKSLAPIALREIDRLISEVAPVRFNDTPTQSALDLLRELHRELGSLLENIDAGAGLDAAIGRVDKLRKRMAHVLMESTKLTLLMPAATLGVTQILSLISKTEVDLQSMATIYVALIGHDGWKAYVAAGSSPGSRRLTDSA